RQSAVLVATDHGIRGIDRQKEQAFQCCDFALALVSRESTTKVVASHGRRIACIRQLRSVVRPESRSREFFVAIACTIVAACSRLVTPRIRKSTTGSSIATFTAMITSSQSAAIIAPRQSGLC